MNGLALFAGIGGLEMGLGLALEQFRTICYVEREVYCARVLAQRMGEGNLGSAPIWDDVETFDARPWLGRVAIVAASPPCQPYSVVGNHEGNDDARALTDSVIRIVKECEPAVIFLENVPGYLNEFEPYWNGFRDLGFEFATPGIYSAWECGAPHLRRRAFITAAHLDARHIWQGSEWEPRRPGRENADASRNGLERLLRTGTEERDAGRVGRESPHPDGQRRVERGSQNAPQDRNDAGRLGPDRKQIPAAWRLSGGRLRGGNVDTPWSIESPLLRVDDGLDDRMEQLRSIGNGVCPTVAQLAFSEQLGELRRKWIRS